MSCDLRRGLRDLVGEPTLTAELLPVDTLLTRVHRGRLVRASVLGVGGAGAAAAITFAKIAITGQRPSRPEQGAPSPTSSPTASPTLSATRSPTVATTPPTASAGSAPTTLALHGRGQTAGFPRNAPETDVVAYLAKNLGSPSRLVLADQACAASAEPGPVLGWDGLQLIVRTSDDDGAAKEPNVAGWELGSNMAIRGLASWHSTHRRPGRNWSVPRSGYGRRAAAMSGRRAASIVSWLSRRTPVPGCGDGDRERSQVRRVKRPAGLGGPLTTRVSDPTSRRR